MPWKRPSSALLSSRLTNQSIIFLALALSLLRGVRAKLAAIKSELSQPTRLCRGKTYKKSCPCQRARWPGHRAGMKNDQIIQSKWRVLVLNPQLRISFGVTTTTCVTHWCDRKIHDFDRACKLTKVTNGLMSEGESSFLLTCGKSIAVAGARLGTGW